MTHEEANIKNFSDKVSSKEGLSLNEARELFRNIIEGKIRNSYVTTILREISLRGEAVDEILAMIQIIKENSITISPNIKTNLIDICGTGGDKIKTFNISTASAIVAASAGSIIAKHGNRSASGLCGSADFLEYIGLDLNTPPTKVQSCIENVGIGFLFAPLFHPSMKSVAKIRKTIGIGTVFNKIGPLSNPCTNLTGQLVGVFEPQLLPIFSEVCSGYVSDAMIVYAQDGFDELSNTCSNDIYWISSENQGTRRVRLHPNSVGMEVAKPEQLTVNSKIDSIASTLQTIYGEGSREKIDIVVLNAAAALVVGKISSNLKEGVEEARHAIKSGKARDKLSQLIKYCGDLERLKEAEKTF